MAWPVATAVTGVKAWETFQLQGCKMNRFFSVGFLVFGMTSMGCGGAKVEGLEGVRPTHPVREAVIESGDAQLGDFVAEELTALGLKSIGPTASAKRLPELGIPIGKALLPENLAKLREQGIDALVVLEPNQSIAADIPQNVQVVLTSTHTRQSMGQFKWHNAWGGMRGSLADATMRKDRRNAAKDIASYIHKAVGGIAPGEK